MLFLFIHILDAFTSAARDVLGVFSKWLFPLLPGPGCGVERSLSHTFHAFSPQSGRSSSRPERAMSAHVSTGQGLGQELHALEDQTSLKAKTDLLGTVWTPRPKIVFIFPGFFQMMSTSAGTHKSSLINSCPIWFVFTL